MGTPDEIQLFSSPSTTKLNTSKAEPCNQANRRKRKYYRALAHPVTTLGSRVVLSHHPKAQLFTQVIRGNFREQR